MQKKEVYLVYADQNYSTSNDSKNEHSGGESTELRGLADSPAASAGLILKDYVQTLQLYGLEEEEFPLVRDPEGDDDSFVVNIHWKDGDESGSTFIRWYVKTVVINELIEED